MFASLDDFAAHLRTRMALLTTAAGSDGMDDVEFDRLALQLFRLQFASNPVYRAWCETRHVTPADNPSWSQLPFVPTAAFKEVDLTSLEPFERTRCFYSSGTTGHRPSRHFHHDHSLALYEQSVVSWFRPHLLPDWNQLIGGIKVISLTPPASEAPHSSLAHMVATVMSCFGSRDSAWVGARTPAGDWVLDAASLERESSQWEQSIGAVLLIGTAFNFVHLLDWAESRPRSLRLPRGSRLMETGGYKGRSRELSPSELHRRLADCLGIESNRVVTEYGMSELSSQAYTRVAGGDFDAGFRFPPWVRARVISPETAEEMPEGQTGVLAILDLANVWSVMAIRTGDLARRQQGRLEWVGRASHDEPRGCSLLTE